MAPLSEFHNQARPSRRPAVYGRRRGVDAETREMHRQLFGTDEYDLENELRKLTIDAETDSHPGRSSQPRLGLSTLPALKSNPKYKQEPKIEVQSQIASTSDSKINESISPGFKAVSISKPQLKSISSEQSASQIDIGFESQSRTSREPATSSKVDGAPKRPAQGRKQPIGGRGRRRRGWEMAALTVEEEERLKLLLPHMKSGKHVIDFEEYISARLSKYNVSKIGEGSYSEVFRFTDKASPYDASVFKIIPFYLQPHKGGSESTQKPEYNRSQLEDVAREVAILEKLQKEHGFTMLRSFQIVRGKWHQELIKAFKTFAITHPKWAENEDPSKGGDGGLYGVIEMEYAGEHLEDLKKPSQYQIFDVFWKTTLYLALAEKHLEFEHRDLHMSNICFRSREKASDTEPTDSAPVLGRSGLEITIIDYTLSRMRSGDNVLWNPSGVGAASMAKPCKTSHQTWTIWQSRRWCTEEEARVLVAGTGEKPADRWRQYMPKTNVIWLGHLLWELLERGLEVKEAETAAGAALQRDLWRRLQVVLGVISTDDLGTLPESAESLLNMGMEQEWVAQSDIKAFVEKLNSENE